MKFFHISDLHLGKRFGEYSLYDDQKFILDKILSELDRVGPDALIIAGDVYDKSSPPAEAVTLFDNFLTCLGERDTEVFIISGNHDSAERLAFASRLIEGQGIHISKPYKGETQMYSLRDEYGEINIYLLPFIKPSNVRKYTDEEITSYNRAVKFAVDSMKADTSVRNILVTHQFVTGSATSDSEDISVGGTDNVDASVFGDFDYVALGHLHTPQSPAKNIRYCGTPLKYSFSECKDKKSITLVDMKEKGNTEISLIPLVPLRDAEVIKGKYSELMQKSFYEGTSRQRDFMKIILTDEEKIPDVHAKLRTVYRNISEIDYENSRTAVKNRITAADISEKKSPYEYFSDFYALQNNSPLNEKQREYIKNLTERIWEGEE